MGFLSPALGAKAIGGLAGGAAGGLGKIGGALGGGMLGNSSNKTTCPTCGGSGKIAGPGPITTMPVGPGRGAASDLIRNLFGGQ